MSKSESERQTHARRLLAAAVLAGAIVGLIITAFAGESQRRFVFDNWQRLGAHQVETDDVAVVMIDDASVRDFGQWPWLRVNVATLIDRIASSNPAAIGIDIYFTEPDPLRPEAFAAVYPEGWIAPDTLEEILALPSGDTDLASVLGRTPSVIARVGSNEGGRPIEDLTFETVEGSPPQGALRVDRILTSIDAFDVAAFSRGFVNGPPDDDGVVRSVPLSILAGEAVATSFAVELAKQKSRAESLRWEGNDLLMGDTAIPSSEDARFRFKIAPYPPSSIIPAADVFTDDFPFEQLAGKVVILGVGATGTGDIVATPVDAEMLGTLVQAQAVDAILKGNGLSRPEWITAIEFAAAAALLALLLAAALTFNNRYLWPAAILALGLPIASFIAFDAGNMLFNPAPGLTIGLFAAIALLLVRYALALAELVEQRIFAAEQKKENQAARDIQMSMVPSAATLSRLDERAEIGAVLEPAKSVGGDFFDAVKIGQDQLLFLVGDVSGKGMPAALFMALSKTLSKSNLVRAGDGLEAAVASLNHELMEEADDEMGLTMLIGLVTCSTGELQLVNAGHENPMVVHADGTVETLEMVGGPPFCVIEFPYPTENFRLAKGDTLVVITDGATEAFNATNQQFGNRGVLDALAAAEETSAAGRAAHLATQVRLFEGDSDPTDDLTIFALRYLGQTAEV